MGSKAGQVPLPRDVAFELIPALAGVLKRAFWAFLSACAQPFLWSTCGPLGIKIFGQRVCVFAPWAQSCSVLNFLEILWETKAKSSLPGLSHCFLGVSAGCLQTEKAT